MKIEFIGTRAHTDLKSKNHRYNTCILLSYKDTYLLIDCGEGTPLPDITPTAVLLTHTHEDHVSPSLLKFVLENEIPLYLTRESYNELSKKYDLSDVAVIIDKKKDYKIGSLIIRAIPVIHSTRSPAVGYYIKGDKRVFITPDFLSLTVKDDLPDIDIWIGDGSSVLKNIVRIVNGRKVGHSSMFNQYKLAREKRASKVIFTHIGTEGIELGDDGIIAKLSEALNKDVSDTVIIAKDGMVLDLAKLIKEDNVEDYDPSKLPDDVLLDDHRLVIAWYKAYKGGRLKKRTLKDIITLLKKIVKEMKNRGIQFHPEEWSDTAKELYKVAGIDISTLSDPRIYITQIYREVQNGEPQELNIYLVGGLANKGVTDGDIDILIDTEERNPAIEEMIYEFFPERWRDRISVVYKLKEAVGNKIPILKLKLEPANVEVKGDTETFTLLEAPPKPFKPMKSQKGYHAAEFGDVEDAWKYWALQYIDQGRCIQVDPKYDGNRIVAYKIGDDVKLYTEDTRRDISKNLPTVVEAIKKGVKGDAVLDGEMVEWSENWGEPLARQDMQWMISAKKKKHPDTWVRYNVFDIIWYEGRLLVDLPLQERNKYLEKAIPKNLPNLWKADHKIVCNHTEWEKAMKWAFNYIGSEGAMLKVADSKYKLNEARTPRTPEWAKCKKVYEVDCLVLDKKKIQKNGKTVAYQYVCGLLVPAKDVPKFYSKDLVQVRGKYYYKLGKTYNTSINVSIGSILTVTPGWLNVEEVEGKLKLHWVYPIVEYPRPEKNEADDVWTAIKLFKERRIGKLEKQLDAVIEVLPVCPHFRTPECPYFEELTKRFIQRIVFPYTCKWMGQYRCPYVKDYFYIIVDPDKVKIDVKRRDN